MFAEVCRRNALLLVQAYADATGRTESGVSNVFYGNGSFFADLRARKRTISVERFGEMLNQFAVQWPDGVPWPSLVPLSFVRESLIKRGQLSDSRPVTNLELLGHP